METEIKARFASPLAKIDRLRLEQKQFGEKLSNEFLESNNWQPGATCSSLIAELQKQQKMLNDAENEFRNIIDSLNELQNELFRDPEIYTLKKELEEVKIKNEKLTRMVEELTRKNNSLLKKYETIHEENRRVYEENRKVYEENRKVNEENRKFYEESRKVSEENRKVNEENQKLYEENRKINEENQKLYEENQMKTQKNDEDVQFLMGAYKDIRDELDDKKAMLHLGQVPFILETEIFRYVFPDAQVPKADLFKKMEEMLEALNEEENEAQERWNDLRIKLDWIEDTHKEGIHILKKLRLCDAHPDVDIEEARRRLATGKYVKTTRQQTICGELLDMIPKVQSLETKKRKFPTGKRSNAKKKRN